MRKQDPEKTINCSTIYRAIADGLLDNGKTQARRFLRRKGKPRKSKGHQENRGKFPVSNTLEQRPEAANNRIRIGDWELDTVLGKVGGACLVTAVCRKSRFVVVKKIRRKKAACVNEALISILAELPVHTLTPDRGKEFAQYSEVTKAIGAQFYFPEPRQAWQEEEMTILMPYYDNTFQNISLSKIMRMNIFNQYKIK